MFNLGDIVAVAGRSMRMMVVDCLPGKETVVVAWRRASGKVQEATMFKSTLVLLQRA